MKYIYHSALLASMIIAAPIMYAIDEQDVACYQEFDHVENLRNQFDQLLRKLDHEDIHTDRYHALIPHGMGLIETAAKHINGIITAEKILWYRELLNKHEELTSHIQKNDPSYIKLLALKKVLIEKILDLMKTYNNNNQSQQQDVSDDVQQASSPSNCS